MSDSEEADVREAEWDDYPHPDDGLEVTDARGGVRWIVAGMLGTAIGGALAASCDGWFYSDDIVLVGLAVFLVSAIPIVWGSFREFAFGPERRADWWIAAGGWTWLAGLFWMGARSAACM